MIRWLRVVMPPESVLLLAGFVYGFVQASAALFAWRLGQPLLATYNSIALPFFGFFAVLYALYRALVFHPLVRPGYCQWLAGTPWTSRQPLPLGPIHLVWQDAALVGLAVAFLWPSLRLESLDVAQLFLAVYVAVLAVLHANTGQKLWSYAVFFLMGIMPFFWHNPAVCLGLAALCYGLCFLGLREAMARFPWSNVDGVQALQHWLRSSLFGEKRSQSEKLPLAWPFDRMGPRFLDIPEYGLGLSDTLLSGLLVGWWFFVCGIRQHEANVEEILPLFYFYGLVILVIGRLYIYCNGFLPPLNLLGRVVHGRWIIPGYDQVFLAPLLAALVGVAAMASHYWVKWAPWQFVIIMSAAVTLTWWILCGLGPSLKIWRLTGNHRIVCGNIKEVVQAG